MINKKRRWLRWSLQLTAVMIFFVLLNLYNTRDAPSGPAPAISGQLLDATPVSLQALRGKPVLLQFCQLVSNLRHPTSDHRCHSRRLQRVIYCHGRVHAG